MFRLSIKKACAFKPNVRYFTPEQMLSDLKNALNNQPFEQAKFDDVYSQSSSEEGTSESVVIPDVEKASDVEGFSNIINKLKDDKEFYKNASENSKYISEYYSKENVAKLWREYYPRIYDKFLKRQKKK